MDDQQWREFFRTARQVLGPGAQLSWASTSWCAWTTFSSLENQLTYWSCGLPEEDELLTSSTGDGGTWSQPFHYSDIAHIIIPSKFGWERIDGTKFDSGQKHQDLDRLSKELVHMGIPHRKTENILEIKLY